MIKTPEQARKVERELKLVDEELARAAMAGYQWGLSIWMAERDQDGGAAFTGYIARRQVERSESFSAGMRDALDAEYRKGMHKAIERMSARSGIA